MGARRFYQFAGTARLNDDPEVDRVVWDNSPELEQQRDPERLGKPIVVELTSVRGRNDEGMVMMEADAS